MINPALVCKIRFTYHPITTAAMADEAAVAGASGTMGDAVALAVVAHGEYGAGDYNTFCYNSAVYCNDALEYDIPLFSYAGDIFHEQRGAAAEAFSAKMHRKQPA